MRFLNFFKNKKQAQEVGSIKKINELQIKKSIDTQKEGYIELGEICLNETNRTELVGFINSLEDYTGDEEYVTTLHYVIDSLYQKGNYFIIHLDWKQEISSLTHGVDWTLRENFQQLVELPSQDDYGEGLSVSHKNIFKDFDKAINKVGCQLSFIDTNSDEYIVVVHKKRDLEKVKSAVLKVGYECLSASSRKISG